MRRRYPMNGADTSQQRRGRLSYVALTLVVVVCGLIWRRPELGLPPLVAKYGGSMLWGVMVFLVVAALRPRVTLFRVAMIAAIVAATVEFSQLIEIEWLDRFRRTAIGALLLGRTFAWWDIAAYWAGIAAAFAVSTAFESKR